MKLGYLLQAIWAVLFLWYVITRLRVVKGHEPETPLWHNPIAAARAFWLELWELPQVGWALVALLVATHATACLGAFAWHCATGGWPTSLSAPCLQALVDVRVSAAAQLLLLPQFGSLAWREMIDAATFYPIYQLGEAALPVCGLGLVVALGWVWSIRDQVARPDRLPAPRFRESVIVIAIGLTALVGLGSLELASRGLGPQDRVILGAVLELLARPIVQGGALGLISLVCVDIILALPLEPDRIARRWLRTLPGFVLVAALPALVRAAADTTLPGWETDRLIARQEVAAAWWVLTRLAWLLALPMWLSMSYTRHSFARVYRDAAPFWYLQWRAVGVASMRGIVVLAPALLALRMLAVLAPPSGLLPGMAVVVGSWLLGVTALGAALLTYREMRTA